MTGTPFGRYRLVRLLARGGMAEVFLATLTGAAGFEKRLALKKILPIYGDLEEFTRLFRDEARICAALDHGNIVQVFDYGEVDGQHYIAMEYIDGPDLEKVLSAARKLHVNLSIDAVLYVAIRVSAALDHAHRHTDEQGRPIQLVHRDVSPGNVLLSVSGEVKITDFGVARFSDRTSSSQAGVVRGKYAYMSPEQVQGQDVDLRSDVFSLGILIYEMATGFNPFQAASDFHTMEAIVAGRYRPLHELRPDAPRDLSRVVARCLDVRVDRRYGTAEDVRRELAGLMWNRGVMDDTSLLLDDLVRIFPKQLQRRGVAARPRTPGAAAVGLPRMRGGGEGAADERKPPSARPRSAQLGPEDGRDREEAYDEDDLTIPHVGNPDAIPTQPIGVDDVDAEGPPRSISDPFLPNSPRIRKDGVRLAAEVVRSAEPSASSMSAVSDDWAQASLASISVPSMLAAENAGSSLEFGAGLSAIVTPSSPLAAAEPEIAHAPTGAVVPSEDAVDAVLGAPGVALVTGARPGRYGLGSVTDIDDADMNPPSAIGLTAIRFPEAPGEIGSLTNELEPAAEGPLEPLSVESVSPATMESVHDASAPVDESARTIPEPAVLPPGGRGIDVAPPPAEPPIADERTRTVHAPTLSAQVDQGARTVQDARPLRVPVSPVGTGPPPGPDLGALAETPPSTLPSLSDRSPVAVGVVSVGTPSGQPPSGAEAGPGSSGSEVPPTPDAAARAEPQPPIGPTRAMAVDSSAAAASGLIPMPETPTGGADPSPASGELASVARRKKRRKKKAPTRSFPWLSTAGAFLATALMFFVLRERPAEAPPAAVTTPSVRVTPPKAIARPPTQSTPVPIQGGSAAVPVSKAPAGGQPPPPTPIAPVVAPPPSSPTASPTASPAARSPSVPSRPVRAADPVPAASTPSPAPAASPTPAKVQPTPRAEPPPRPEPTPKAEPTPATRSEPTPATRSAPLRSEATPTPAAANPGPSGSFQVSISSDPAGASLMIGGRNVGKAPWVGRGKTGDLLEVTARLDGFQPTTRMLRVGSADLEMVVQLTVAAGSGGEGTVYISSEPLAYVYIDGKVTGKVTPIRLTLTVGTHEIVLENPDAGWSARKTVLIEAGKGTELRLQQ